MSGFWAIFWLALVMKIPIAMLLYLVWWAVKDPPLTEAAADDGDGGSGRHGPRPRLPRPQPPRRGPHGDPSPRSPERVRATSRQPRVPGGHLPDDS